MKIKFLPQNIEVEATPDKTLLQIATENQLEIRSICKGVPSCAECRVRIKEGDSNCLPPNKAELSLIGTSYFIDGRRLSCQVHCFGDVTVDLTEQVERQENQTKKIRGFRSNKQVESKAVNDMMLLNEKDEVKESSHKEHHNEPRAEKEAQEGEQKPQQQAREQRPQQNRDNRNQQQRGGGGGGQQNQQRQKQNQNQNQNRGQQQGKQQQGKQQQQNRQPQNQNKQQNQQQRQNKDGQQQQQQPPTKQDPKK